MKVKEKKWIRFRIYLVALFFLAGLGTILARAYLYCPCGLQGDHQTSP
jgi:hypothetical protein